VYDKLERNGTELKRFKMNQASVLEAGLRETSGMLATRLALENIEFALDFFEFPGGARPSLANEVGKSLPADAAGTDGKSVFVTLLNESYSLSANSE